MLLSAPLMHHELQQLSTIIPTSGRSLSVVSMLSCGVELAILYACSKHMEYTPYAWNGVVCITFV